MLGSKGIITLSPQVGGINKVIKLSSQSMLPKDCYTGLWKRCKPPKREIRKKRRTWLKNVLIGA